MSDHIPAPDGRCQCIHDWHTICGSVIYGLVHGMVDAHPDPQRLRDELAHVDTLLDGAR